MFTKKCKRCARKIDKDFGFCPYCGFNIKREEEERNFGFLGREDNFSPDLNIGMPFGLNRLFSSLLKQIDSQFKQLDKEIGKEFKEEKERKPIISRGISISISTSNNKKPEIKVSGFGPGYGKLIPIEPMKTIKTKPSITEEEARKLSKLPREEASTSVRRLSNKLIYEINLPNINSIKDVIINKLENSIEIKAFSKDKVYFKLLPVKLPLLNYKLEKEKLILELKA
jgi:hypothetical protein